jgi:hypothetical protein
VTFHVKSVQVLGEGMRFAEVQLPISALMPVAVGSSELLCSYPRQAAFNAAANAHAVRMDVFFMTLIVAREWLLP